MNKKGRFLVALKGVIFPLSCGEPQHPTSMECTSTEAAARAYYRMITQSDPSDLSFEREPFTNELTGYRIYDAERPLETIVVRNADCSLQFFSNLILD